MHGYEHQKNMELPQRKQPTRRRPPKMHTQMPAICSLVALGMREVLLQKMIWTDSEKSINNGNNGNNGFEHYGSTLSGLIILTNHKQMPNGHPETLPLLGPSRIESNPEQCSRRPVLRTRQEGVLIFDLRKQRFPCEFTTLLWHVLA